MTIGAPATVSHHRESGSRSPSNAGIAVTRICCRRSFHFRIDFRNQSVRGGARAWGVVTQAIRVLPIPS